MTLLDTCTLLWLVSGSDRLHPTARQTILANRGQLFVSAISAFEIGIKTAKGRLALPLPPQEWFERALRFHGLREIPVTASIALRSTQLPPVHDDPADRMIVATAIDRGLLVVTPDSLIGAYQEVSVTWQ